MMQKKNKKIFKKNIEIIAGYDIMLLRVEK